MSKPKRPGFSLADLTGDLPPEAEAVTETVAAAPSLAAARKATPKAINIYISPADHKRLLMLSVSLETKLQQLGHEAWNLLLRKHGLPELEPTKAPSAKGRKGE